MTPIYKASEVREETRFKDIYLADIHLENWGEGYWQSYDKDSYCLFHIAWFLH